MHTRARRPAAAPATALSDREGSQSLAAAHDAGHDADPPPAMPVETARALGHHFGNVSVTPPSLPIQAMFEPSRRRFTEETRLDADVKSEDKTFHQGERGRVWAVGADAKGVEAEFNALATMDEHVPTVLAGNVEDVEHQGRGTKAYPMRWIEGGISSKSKRNDFLAELAGLSGKKRQRALADLARFEVLSQTHEVGDLQVLLDPETGGLFANDPRFIRERGGGGTADLKRLAEWRGALGKETPGLFGDWKGKAAGAATVLGLGTAALGGSLAAVGIGGTVGLLGALYLGHRAWSGRSRREPPMRGVEELV